jgi:hypothetical protein
METPMKRISVSLFAAMISTSAMAEDFDPVKFGLTSEHAEEPTYCSFLRNAVEGKNKVWKCSDGSVRYGETNIWGADGVPTPTKPPEDLAILIDDGVLMTVEVVADQKECRRIGKHHHCDRYSVPTFSYVMTENWGQCEHMAPRLAARQYISYRDLGVPVKITFKCEGGIDADIRDFVIYPIPGMPSILGVPGVF